MRPEQICIDLLKENKKLIDSLENILDSLDEGVYVPTREQRLPQDMFRMRNRTPSTTSHGGGDTLFMEDAPYCFIERVFENPHDKPINVEIRKEKIHVALNRVCTNS